REAARRMLPRGRGTIFFTGATASMRGRAGFSAFAGAKHGLRALAQSMARELGPQGIHVVHPVIDGAIDTAWIRENFPDAAALAPQDGI
ncbi:SDR family NAD(P)-dependent oxidoreductase, partial [Acinetobacter baumannii]